MTMYKLSQRSLERLEGVDQRLIEIIKKGITNSPYDFGIPQYGGLRTVKDQQELYAKGRTDFSTHTRPVTYVDGVNKKSYHQSGKAFDIYIYDHETKRASWNVDKLTAVARHLQEIARGMGIELEYGGDWTKFKDYPHFQI